MQWGKYTLYNGSNTLEYPISFATTNIYCLYQANVEDLIYSFGVYSYTLSNCKITACKLNAPVPVKAIFIGI